MSPEITTELPTGLLITLGVIFVLLILSAFFSSSETALTAVSKPRMHEKAKKGDKRAHIVNTLWADNERLIGAILLGNNLVNIMATALLTSVLTVLFGEAGVAYATAAMTLTVLIFSEVIPKTYALQNASRVALAVSPFIRLWILLSWPFTWAVQKIAVLLMRLFLGSRVSQQKLSYGLSEEELRGAIDLHGRQGDSNDQRQETAMLQSILDLGAVSVAKVMTHRRNVEMLDISLPQEEFIEAVTLSPYTRLPLWEEDQNNIVGVLHVKALLRRLQKEQEDDYFDIRELASDPWFIPETANLLDQLQAFRTRREHFALVVDEYGDLQGIVTLEDILEEIVGEISDEHDIPVTGVQRLPDGSFHVQGTVPVRDVNREFQWNLPEDPAATLAGLVMHQARCLPEVGQVFTFFGFRFEIVRRKRYHITLIKVTPPEQNSETVLEPQDRA